MGKHSSEEIVVEDGMVTWDMYSDPLLQLTFSGGGGGGGGGGTGGPCIFVGVTKIWADKPLPLPPPPPKKKGGGEVLIFQQNKLTS